MENLKLETDAVDSQHETSMNFESFEFKNELPDTKYTFKRETKETVHDNSHDFVA